MFFIEYDKLIKYLKEFLGDDKKMICRFCKKEIDKSIAYKHNNTDKAYYCNYEHWKMQQEKSKYKPKKTKKNGEPNERRELTDLIMSYYIEQGIEKHTINWSIETARIKNILDEHKDWLMTGLTYTLKYMHDIEEVNLFSEQTNCIMALVPFYYVKAMEYYNETTEIEDAINNFNFSEKVIKIKKGKHKHNKFKEINIDNL